MVASNQVSEHLFPFEGQHVEIGGNRIHVLDEGSGPPVLMVHGNPTWSFYYRNLVLELRKDHRVVVPDHVGCGYSDKPSQGSYPYNLERRVDDLDELVGELGLGDGVTLIAHDWGGMIGMAWAARHPGRVARIALMNTAAFPNPRGLKIPWRLKLLRDTPLGRGLVLGLNAFAKSATFMAVHRQDLPGDVAAAYLAPYDSWDNRIATLRFVEDIPLKPGDPSYDLVRTTGESLAAYLETPALICWGRKDFVFGDAFLAEWQRRWPHARVRVYEDSGHYVLEDAREEVIEEIRAFLAANPLRASAS